MRRKFLLGATADREIVFADFGVRHWNGCPEYSASFDMVSPFRTDDVDLVEYFEGFVDNIGKEAAYDLCERNRCAPQDLPEILASECYDPRDALDCSLYPEEFVINDEYWYFASSSCGQCDTRKYGMDEYTNKEAYDIIHELWDKYHLKEADGECIALAEKAIKLLEDIDEEQWIADYIRRNF